MLEKLTTHDNQDVTELFSLVDKCVKAIEGHAWHTSPAPGVGKDSKPNAGAATQGGNNNNNKNKNKKKKACSNNQPLTGAPTAAVGGGHGPRGDKHPRQASGSDNGDARCPVHNSTCHSMRECREIKKLVEHFREKQRQLRLGTPSTSRRANKRWTLRRRTVRRWSSRTPSRS
jgi:hypothetical protein